MHRDFFIRDGIVRRTPETPAPVAVRGIKGELIQVIPSPGVSVVVYPGAGPVIVTPAGKSTL
jgi:hypothetical protein